MASDQRKESNIKENNSSHRKVDVLFTISRQTDRRMGRGAQQLVEHPLSPPLPHDQFRDL
jgi:hypothetical protein